MKLYYSPDYAASKTDFPTTKKAKWIADSLCERPIDGVEIVEPTPLDYDDIESTHDKTYVDAILSGDPHALASSSGFPWDEDTWRRVTSSNGGVLAACLTALDEGVSGSLSSGLHHARKDEGRGFCTFNGIAIAANYLYKNHQVNTLIIDLDAHFGGGTFNTTYHDPNILDVATCHFDYPLDEDMDERGLFAKERLIYVDDPSTYLQKIEKELNDHALWEDVGLVIYNAGMDPYEKDQIGGLKGITKNVLRIRENLVFSRCEQRKVPVAFVVAGGYIGNDYPVEELTGLHRMTVERAAKRGAT